MSMFSADIIENCLAKIDCKLYQLLSISERIKTKITYVYKETCVKTTFEASFKKKQSDCCLAISFDVSHEPLQRFNMGLIGY